MVEFAILLLCVQVYFYYKVDTYVFGTFLTPTIALTVPYLIVLISHYFLHDLLQFKDISAESVLVWNIGTAIFWCSGLIIAKFFLNRRVKYPFKHITGLDIKVRGLHPSLLIITYFLITIMCFSLYRAISNLGIGSIGSEDFAIVFAGGGIFGHSLNLLRFLVVYLIVKTSKRQIQTNFAIALIIVFNLIFLGKSWLLLPLLSAIIIRLFIVRGIKAELSFRLVKIILGVAILGFIVFSSFYYLSLGSELPFTFVFFHFFNYLWGGAIGISEAIKSIDFTGGMTYQIFNPLTNLYNKLLGKPMVTQAHIYFYNVYIPYEKFSNVFTFFGTILIFGGKKLFVPVTLIFGGISYFLLVTVAVLKNTFFLVLYFLFFTALLFGWFDFYFHHLFFYLIVLFTLFFYFIFWTRNTSQSL